MGDLEEDWMRIARLVSNNRSDVTQVNSKVQVEVNRAPTDESLRLLKELQDKALESVIQKVELKNNFIEGCLFYTFADLEGLICRMRFELNGKRYETDLKIGHYEVIHLKNPHTHYNQETLQFLAKKVSEIITSELLRGWVDTDNARSIGIK